MSDNSKKLQEVYEYFSEEVLSNGIDINSVRSEITSYIRLKLEGGSSVKCNISLIKAKNSFKDILGSPTGKKYLEEVDNKISEINREIS